MSDDRCEKCQKCQMSDDRCEKCDKCQMTDVRNVRCQMTDVRNVRTVRKVRSELIVLCNRTKQNCTVLRKGKQS